MTSNKEYALYKGDTILAFGTIEQIATKTKVKVNTIKFYNSNTYRKRIAKRKSKKCRELTLIEDDE